MTTYLLHGGRTSTHNKKNDEFFAKFTQLVKKDKVVILLCYFAIKPNRWDELVERDTLRIMVDLEEGEESKEVEILVAQDSEDLLNKMDKSDVLYIAGGEPELIEPFYDGLVGLKEKLYEKVFIGSSMGMFFASEQYVTSFDHQDSYVVKKGIGLLPIQTLCHWDVEDKKDMKLELLRESSDVPVLVLGEYEWVVFYG